ncbi:hypothetical protein SM757_23110 [Azohydromonas lata]|uniref:DNA gyrase subunit B n=2 Tax=Azohydromonas lata TaxID=45677 RepID=A0ABU5IKR4_9BURK|nr:hypothetical protein [Azohydromonas lata]MDZ5459474.1 hypothetical protein [Azohydromonas lata]
MAVYAGMAQLQPRWMALVLLTLALARAAVARGGPWLAAGAGAALLAAAAWWGNAWLPLKLYPVLVNAALLLVFGASLLRGPSLVERLARLREPDLPPAGVAYTRRVTQAWCGFFVVNGSIALSTALWGSDAAWALYNGLLAYGLMGLFFGVEWLLRQRLKARLRHAGGAHG